MGLMDKFKSAAQTAQAGMQMPTQDDVEYMQRVQRLGQEGVEAPATINALGPTGRTDPGGGQEHRIEVTVEPAGGAPYQASFTQFMHVQTMGSWATPGARVTVKADPQDPQSLILWGGAG
jgi:hypothetical protein